MNRGFIRVLFGDSEIDFNDPSFIEDQKKNNRCVPTPIFNDRRKKIHRDIECCLAEKNIYPFITYVFGTKNYDFLMSQGVESVLLDDHPYVYKGYHHKLKALEAAMSDFDEVVLLDWDTKPKCPMDEHFWSILNKKDVIQSSLWKFRHPRINYRKNDEENKITPAGAFIYIRGKEVAKKLIDLSFKANGDTVWSAEIPIAKLTDDMMGGWKGIDVYWHRFEPEVYHTKRSPYRGKNEYVKEKIYFVNRGHSWSY